MKTYIDHNSAIQFENNWIPKDPSNRDYVQFLRELKEGKAELVPYVPPTPTWVEIRGQRNALLQETDWTALTDVGEVTNKKDWVEYRKKLRSLPQDYSTPESVVWPQKPV
jgi:hypothetical protein